MATNIARTLSTSIFFGIVIGVLAMILSPVFIPLKYGAEARVLVSPHAIPGVDPYTSSKAAERIAQNVAQVVNTSDFFNRVISVGVGIDANYFPQDELQRRKVWQDTIEASSVYNTGILDVVAYHADKKQAEAIANAVAYVLTQSGNDYAVSSADFRLIDKPIASQYPKKPNFPAIGLGGFL
ncbi:MAG: hypothetical protein NT003_04580, partial [Candidatus Magasanikbacteria bacterium]|nr:hypothetical protein [Candidatus Magasanikbacteria bacterium]